MIDLLIKINKLISDYKIVNFEFEVAAFLVYFM